MAAPIITELNTPRFLASGDTSRLTLDLTNLTDQSQTLNIALTATGKVSLEGAQPDPVKLPLGARSTLFIPVRALEGYGDGEVTAQVTGLQLLVRRLCRSRRAGKLVYAPHSRRKR